MSKMVYDEVQQFLLDKWGPMGGWAQAVMFAADLKETTIKLGTGGTPKKGGTPVKPTVIKSENPAIANEPALDPSNDKALNGTPKTPGSAKRKAGNHGSVPDSTLDSPSSRSRSKTSPGSELPAGYGFKRTRSAARIELQRQSSGVSLLAEDVKDLDV
jgi:N-glycosylase/DNA lyase